MFGRKKDVKQEELSSEEKLQKLNEKLEFEQSPAFSLVRDKNIEELKKQYSIFTVPSDQKEKLEQHNPKIISKTLGNMSAVLDSSIEIADAQINRPTLSDLFLEKVGGSNEKV